MEYTQVKKRIYAYGTIPDGYNGKTCEVGFAFDSKSGKTFAVHAHGYFTYHIPPAVDYAESYWLLLNHPSSNATDIKLLTIAVQGE